MPLTYHSVDIKFTLIDLSWELYSQAHRRFRHYGYNGSLIGFICEGKFMPTLDDPHWSAEICKVFPDKNYMVILGSPTPTNIRSALELYIDPEPDRGLTTATAAAAVAAVEEDDEDVRVEPEPGYYTRRVYSLWYTPGGAVAVCSNDSFINHYGNTRNHYLIKNCVSTSIEHTLV